MYDFTERFINDTIRHDCYPHVVIHLMLLKYVGSMKHFLTGFRKYLFKPIKGIY